jgi:hypothetical protein
MICFPSVEREYVAVEMHADPESKADLDGELGTEVNWPRRIIHFAAQAWRLRCDSRNDLPRAFFEWRVAHTSNEKELSHRSGSEAVQQLRIH